MKNSILILLLSLLAAGVTAACGSPAPAPKPPESTDDEPITGGVEDNTDYDAPKTIESKELTSLSMQFYAYGDFYSDVGEGLFRYELKEEAGKLILAETSYYNVTSEVDKGLLAEAQALIDKYHLASLNGRDRVTGGLPPDYGPWSFKAVYASGEKISFYEDGDPYAEWTRAFRKLFNRALTEAGIEATAPDPADYTIDHFSLEFNDGALGCHYGTLETEEGTKLWCQVWDMDKNELVSERYAGMEDGFLEKFSDEIEALELQRLDSVGGQFIEHTPDGYLEIHIDYVSGRKIYGDYGPDEIPEAWKEVRGEVREFLDGYIETHLVSES